MSFSPYLFFSGNCAEAFAFYAEVFGKEPQVMTMADVPPDAAMPGADPASVMHASIELNGSFLMGSDDPTGDGGPKVGSAVAYSATEVAEAEKVFAGLSAGGEVTAELGATFWSPAFGMVTDKFGVSWMIDTWSTPPE